MICESCSVGWGACGGARHSLTAANCGWSLGLLQLALLSQLVVSYHYCLVKTSNYTQTLLQSAWPQACKSQLKTNISDVYHLSKETYVNSHVQLQETLVYGAANDMILHAFGQSSVFISTIQFALVRG